MKPFFDATVKARMALENPVSANVSVQSFAIRSQHVFNQREVAGDGDAFQP